VTNSYCGCAACSDIHLANEILGFQPKTGIEEGLKRFADWYHSKERQDSFSTVAE